MTPKIAVEVERMSLFGKLVKTTINVGIGLPVAIVKDVLTLGGVCDDRVCSKRTSLRRDRA